MPAPRLAPDSAALSARGYRHPLLGKASPGSPAAPAAELLRHAADRTALLAIARDTLRGLLDAAGGWASPPTVCPLLRRWKQVGVSPGH